MIAPTFAACPFSMMLKNSRVVTAIFAATAALGLFIWLPEKNSVAQMP
jgi:hypothetical protein